MAREYATQMEAARKGIITEELKSVAKKERMSVEELLPLVAEGKVVICANKNHKCIDPQGVGSMLSTKTYGCTCNYGSFFTRKYHTVSPQADRRMSGNDRNRSGL